ncbi:MAG: carbon storage regulator [Planctomycetota bacterium]|jgi:preprotein translocase subunit YajC
MKEVFQKKGETVVVNGDICVTVLEIHDDEVVLAVDAPAWNEVGGTKLPTATEDCRPLLPR